MSTASWFSAAGYGPRLQRNSRALTGRLLRMWHGPPELPAHLRMEQRFVVNRYLSLVLLAPAIPMLGMASTQMITAYVLLACAAIYNLAVHHLLRRRSAWLDNGYLTTVGDGLLVVGLTFIGGGFSSPFFFLLVVQTLSAAMRFGYRPALLIVTIYGGLDGLNTFTTHAGAYGDFVFRLSTLILTALLSSYLWDEAQRAGSALAQQLARARALNDSTRALGDSLHLPTVLRTVAVEVGQLAHAAAAAVQLNGTPGSAPVYHIADAGIAQAVLDGLLVAHPQPADVVSGALDPEHTFMVVPLHGRSAVWGTVVVVRSGTELEAPERELLVAFIERATLAIENAALYQTIDDGRNDLERAYADLAEAHQELLGVDEMKTGFLANVSHELRTPLTSIRSFSELLLSYDIDPETEREFLGIINTESERLTRLINDVLDVTKIEAGQMAWQMKPHDLATILVAGTRTFTALTDEKGLRFEFIPPPEPVTVMADRDRILQVLANLLGNAVKFTKAGEVVLSAVLTPQDVEVHVRDTGLGIAPADHTRIFEKFHQVGDTLTDKPTGTGLGLCISRDIVQHHGGRMWVTSALNEGSTFSFSLPRVPADTPATPL